MCVCVCVCMCARGGEKGTDYSRCFTRVSSVYGDGVEGILFTNVSMGNSMYMYMHVNVSPV